MINPLFLLVVAAPMLFQAQQTSKPTNPDVAPMTLTGCLSSAPVDPNNAADKRVIYTLVIAQPSRGQAVVAGTSGRAQSPEEPEKVQLSTAEAKGLAKYVGQEIQVSGELLQPPGLPPAAAKATPLPRNAEGTFRVSSVKPVASKCR